MKLLKSLSFLSLPILTVSFAHAFDNDWGQWQDDSFNIEIIEDINDDIQDSVEDHRKKNTKSRSINIANDDYNSDELTELSEEEILENNQENDDSQYVENDVTDYENKDRFSLPAENITIELNELDAEIETPEFESDFEFTNIENEAYITDYEDNKVREGIEPPEFDYQDYEYKIELPVEDTNNETPSTDAPTE